MTVHVVRVLDVTRKTEKRKEKIRFNIILRSGKIPILGKNYTSPKHKMFTTSNSTQTEYIWDIHSTQSHAQPQIIKVLLWIQGPTEYNNFVSLVYIS